MAPRTTTPAITAMATFAVVVIDEPAAAVVLIYRGKIIVMVFDE